MQESSGSPAGALAAFTGTQDFMPAFQQWAPMEPASPQHGTRWGLDCLKPKLFSHSGKYY